jgi:hypothetical protein
VILVSYNSGAAELVANVLYFSQMFVHALWPE